MVHGRLKKLPGHNWYQLTYQEPDQLRLKYSWRYSWWCQFRGKKCRMWQNRIWLQSRDGWGTILEGSQNTQAIPWTGSKLADRSGARSADTNILRVVILERERTDLDTDWDYSWIYKFWCWETIELNRVWGLSCALVSSERILSIKRYTLLR